MSKEQLAKVTGESKPYTPTLAPSFDKTITTATDIARQQNQFLEDTEKTLNNVAQATVTGWGRTENNFLTPVIGRKWEAFSHSYDDTWMAKGYDYLKYDRAMYREEDAEWKATFDDDAKFEFMSKYGMGIDDLNDLDEAVSLEHATDIAEMKTIDRERGEDIRNALTQSEQMAASLVTAIADVDIIIGGVGATVAKTISKTAKTSSTIAKVTGGSEAGYGMFIGAVDDDTSMGEAMLMSTLIGVIDYSVIKKLNANDINKLSQASVGGLNDEAITALRNKQDELIRRQEKLEVDVSKTLGKREQISYAKVTKTSEIKTLQKQIDEVEKQADVLSKSKIKTTAKELDRIDELKTQLKKKLTVAKSTGFRLLDEMVKTRIAKTGIKLSDEELQLINQTKRDMTSITDDIELNIAYIKNDLEALAKGDIDTAGEILSVYKRLNKEGKLSNSAMGKLEDSVKKGKDGKYVKPNVEVKPNGANKDMDIKINGKKVGKVGFVLGSGLIGTSAFGYDGSDMIEDYGLILLASVLGIAGLVNAKNIGKLIAEGGQTVQNSVAMAKTVKVRATISKVAEASRTSITETIAPLKKGASEQLNKLIDDIYFNPIDTQKSVERIKNRIYHAHWNTLQKDIQETYVSWLKEAGTSRVEGALSLFKSTSKRYEYDKMITEYIETGAHSEVKSVVDGATQVNKILDSMMEEMVGAGIKDIDKTTILKNYVPRSMKRSNIASALAGATPSSKAAFITEFAKMLTKTKNADKVADVYIDAIINVANGGGKASMSSIDDIKKIADKHGFGDDVVNDIADALGVGGDSFGRLKNRIPMDKKMFKGVKIDYVDGSESVTMGIDDMFEQDIMNIMTDYLNKASGHVAFADMGYKSIDNVVEQIMNSGAKPDKIKTMINDVMALSGSPVIDYGQTINVVMRSVGNLVMASKMGLSTLSLAPEVLTTAARLNKSGWRGVLQQANSKLLSEFGDDSFMMKSLTEEKGLGLGTHQYGASYGGYKSIDEMGMVTGGERGLNVLSKVTEVARDITLHTLPFVKSSDFLTKVNMQDNMQVLYNHMSGAKKFKDYELASYAINDNVEKILKKHFTLNSKGHVQYFDINKLSRTDRTDLYTTMDAMLQKQIQQSTMGTTGAYSRQTALGVVATVLIKFPMSAYSNIGSFLGRGMMAGDAKAMTQTAMWFGGGALATMARNEIKGRDATTDDIMLDALLSHPFAGAYGTAVGLLNPAPTKAMADVQEVVNIYNYK